MAANLSRKAKAMSKLFGGMSKAARKAMQKSQRRQDKAVSQQMSDEAQEAGARRRTMAARRKGGTGMLSPGGASGAKETLG